MKHSRLVITSLGTIRCLLLFSSSAVAGVYEPAGCVTNAEVFGESARSFGGADAASFNASAYKALERGKQYFAVARTGDAGHGFTYDALPSGAKPTNSIEGCLTPCADDVSKPCGSGDGFNGVQLPRVWSTYVWKDDDKAATYQPLGCFSSEDDSEWLRNNGQYFGGEAAANYANASAIAQFRDARFYAVARVWTEGYGYGFTLDYLPQLQLNASIQGCSAPCADNASMPCGWGGEDGGASSKRVWSVYDGDSGAKVCKDGCTCNQLFNASEWVCHYPPIGGGWLPIRLVDYDGKKVVECQSFDSINCEWRDSEAICRGVVGRTNGGLINPATCSDLCHKPPVDPRHWCTTGLSMFGSDIDAPSPTAGQQQAEEEEEDAPAPAPAEATTASSSSSSTGARGTPKEDDAGGVGIAVGVSVGLGALALVLLMVLGLSFFHRRRRAKEGTAEGDKPRELPVPDLNTSTSTSKRFDSTTTQIFASNPWLLRPEQLEIDRCIGKGSYGSVFMGRMDGTPVAIKCIETRSSQVLVSELAGSQDLRMRVLIKEIQLMTSIRNPYCVTFLGVCTDPLAMVAEYCAMGSLYDVMQKASQAQPELMAKLTWRQRLLMAWQAALGMSHLHGKDIVHRDLKSPNILVDKDFNAKVADFGLSSTLAAADIPSCQDQEGRTVAVISTAGTALANLNRRWMAPEVALALASDNPPAQPFAKAADVYSLGLVLLELATFKIPFQELFDMQVMLQISMGILEVQRPTLEQVVGGTFPGLDDYLDLAMHCCSADPEQRPTCKQVSDRISVIMMMQDPPAATTTTVAPSSQSNSPIAAILDQTPRDI